MLTKWRCNIINIRTFSPLEIVPRRPIPKQWQLSVIYLFNITETHWDSSNTLVNLCLFLPTLAGQVGVLHKNIHKYLNGKTLDVNYDGYASCPLVTGYDSCIMAEFDYDLKPKETFPFRQDCERYSMFLLKRDFMPALYWHLMLNGYWNGPEPLRKLLSVVKFN